jgi:hypothetical protein
MTEIKPAAWRHRWKLHGKFVQWTPSPKPYAHLSLKDFEEQPLYSAKAMRDAVLHERKACLFALANYAYANETEQAMLNAITSLIKERP